MVEQDAAKSVFKYPGAIGLYAEKGFMYWPLIIIRTAGIYIYILSRRNPTNTFKITIIII